MRPWFINVAVSLFGVGLIVSLPNLAYAQPADSLSVAREWVKYLVTGNISSALTLLDVDASLIESTSPDGGIATYSNKEQIAGVLLNIVSDHTQIKLIDPPHIVLGTATWTERRSSDSLGKLGVSSIDVVADAIIQQGKLRSLVYELTPASLARVQNAQAGRSTLGMPRTGSIDITPPLLLALFGGATLSLGLAIYSMRHRSRELD